MYDFTYCPDGPFLSHVMDKESVSRVHPRSQSWSRKHRGGIAGEAGCCPRYWVLCWAWEHFSCHMVAKVGPVTEVHKVTEPHSWISVLPLAHVTAAERDAFLDLHPILTLFRHTLHHFRKINSQIIRFLNLQAWDINALFRAITPGWLAKITSLSL